MDRPTLADLKYWLSDQLPAALGERFGELEISFQSRADDVVDGTTVLLLRDAVGRPRAVVLCAAPTSPDMVRRAMYRAREAKTILGPSIGAPILEPLIEGRARELSYAVIPYCNSLSNYRPVWWMQRVLLRPNILQWLWCLTECTVRDADLADIDRSFAEPLRQVSALKWLDSRIRAAAEQALMRLRSGEWRPKHVLMHGDLWKGNIMIRPESHADKRTPWRDRFVIIDWAGSEVSGYAMYDLVRLANSIRLPEQMFRNEVVRHCRLLGCQPSGAMAHLLAALGYILMNLENFPINAYGRTVDACFATLENTLN